MVVAEEGDAEEQVVETVVMAVTSDASQAVGKEILNNGGGFLAGCLRVDCGMGGADGGDVGVETGEYLEHVREAMRWE